MATAKKLPSGNYRCRIFAGMENGKKVYKSFTAPTKKEAELLAVEFSLQKDSEKQQYGDMTLREAINRYINTANNVLSPTTISNYKKIEKRAFQNIMDLQLKKINKTILREAVNLEAGRKSESTRSKGKTISPKTLANEYGLITAVIHEYAPHINTKVTLPAREHKIKELVRPEVILDMVRDTEIELPVLLAMWLSFTISEIKGLTKSKSLQGSYLAITEVSVMVDGKYVTKQQGKAYERNRKLKVPPYIMGLIDKVETDQLVTMSGQAIHHRFTRMLKENHLPHMSFHDLRHLNASVMALLKIPDKYAQERGGWANDKVMKKVYTHTFTDERNAVDETIDNYFDTLIKKSMTQNMTRNKKSAE